MRNASDHWINIFSEWEHQLIDPDRHSPSDLGLYGKQGRPDGGLFHQKPRPPCASQPWSGDSHKLCLAHCEGIQPEARSECQALAAPARRPVPFFGPARPPENRPIAQQSFQPGLCWFASFQRTGRFPRKWRPMRRSCSQTGGGSKWERAAAVGSPGDRSARRRRLPKLAYSPFNFSEPDRERQRERESSLVSKPWRGCHGNSSESCDGPRWSIRVRSGPLKWLRPWEERRWEREVQLRRTPQKHTGVPGPQ